MQKSLYCICACLFDHYLHAINACCPAQLQFAKALMIAVQVAWSCEQLVCFQDEESLDMQAGVQVNNEQEKLVVNALMRYQPTDSAQSRPSSLQQCGECAAWGDGLCSQWVTHCFHSRPAGTLPCHRLYVQAASGEMRLATVMVSEG